VKNNICNYCGKVFGYRTSLGRHIAGGACEGNPDGSSIQTLPKPYPCELCNKSFRTNHSLTDHINAVHKGLKAYQCDRCGKEFGFKQLFYRHIKDENSCNVIDNNRYCSFLEL
jgi:uncharacterized C2H2 Zn-finger protein